MGKLTPFGKAVRKYRVDRGETQNDVADALGVRVTFFSAIETGKKNVPAGLLNGLIEHFGLAGNEAASLRELAFNSKREIKINLDGMDDRSREVVAGFARKFGEIEKNEEKMVKLCELLGIGGKK